MICIHFPIFFKGVGQDHAFLVYRYISEDDENSRWDYKAFNCSAVPWQALLGTAAGKNLWFRGLLHTTYRKNINLEKCAGIGLNDFHIKCIIGTHCNWKNQNPHCCLAGSSKTAPRILISSIAMGTDYTFYVKTIENHARAFLALNILGRVGH